MSTCIRHCAVALVATLAPWTIGAADAAPDVHALAVAEGSLSWCSQHDPAHIEVLRHRIDALTSRATVQDQSIVRSSPAYIRTYQSVVEFAEKLDPRNAARFCAEAAGGSGPRTTGPPKGSS